MKKIRSSRFIVLSASFFCVWFKGAKSSGSTLKCPAVVWVFLW